MQIQNVTLAQNNYSQKRNPNFTAIRSVKCDGLYKKYPELANNLVDAFKANPKAMEFCKKYDVDVVFYALEQYQSRVESSINIFFDNISKSKTKKFFGKLFGNNDDKVVLSACGNRYSIPNSIEDSTAELVKVISPERKVGDKWVGGLLDSHLDSADERVQKVLDKKAAKVQEKAAKLAAQKEAEANLEDADAKLQNSINDLMKQG